MFWICSTCWSVHDFGFLRFGEALQGLKSSRRLVGTISTYFYADPSSWCRVMTKKVQTLSPMCYSLCFFGPRFQNWDLRTCPQGGNFTEKPIFKSKMRDSGVQRPKMKTIDPRNFENISKVRISCFRL